MHLILDNSHARSELERNRISHAAFHDQFGEAPLLIGGESIAEYIRKQEAKLKTDFALVCDTELFAPTSRRYA